MKSALNRILHPLRWILLPVNVLLVALTVFAGYGGCINPDITTVGSMAAMFFPILMIINWVVGALMLILWRKLSLLNLLGALACWGPTSTVCPLNLFRPSMAAIENWPTPTFKVLTFNVYDFRNTDTDDSDSPKQNATLQYILDSQADIVLLQEALDIGREGWCGINRHQVEMIDSVYPYNTMTMRGMVVLSKVPFERVIVAVTDPNQLDLCRYDFQFDGGQKLTLLSLHMQSFGLDDHDKAIYRNITHADGHAEIADIRHSLIRKLSQAFRLRAVQAQDVRQAINHAQTDNIIVCGDFNDVPLSYTSRLIAADDMTDAYSKAARGMAITYHINRFYFRIDQMFYRGNISALRTDVGKFSASDHYPLSTIFCFEQ